MTITFRIRYHTHPGQSLWLAGSQPFPAHPLPMQYLDPEYWQISVPLPASAMGLPLRYAYVLTGADGTQTLDWGRDRTFMPAAYGGVDLLVLDSWNFAGYEENALLTKPFQQVLFANRFTPAKTVPSGSTHTLRVKTPWLPASQTLCLLGEGAALGNWNPEQPVLLRRPRGSDYYSVALDLRGQPLPLAFKYGVFDTEKNTFISYEEGANRQLPPADAGAGHMVVNDGFARLPMLRWRGAGVAVPVFSLRSENSFGVGEFTDLKLLAEWGKKTGLKLIQLLPINDTSATGTWKDSYPYAAISAFALHPLYLNLATAADAKNRRLLPAVEPERQRLNALDAVDYEAVMKAKLEFLRLIFPSQKDTLDSSAYREFFQANEHWLIPYAAFCMLRDKYGTPDCRAWPEHQQYDAQAIAALARRDEDIAFHCFVQYHLHRQLKQAVDDVHAAGLVLKGDLPVGVGRHGADTWQSPGLFHLDRRAGAPPDTFSAKGQNWGLPTYNWPCMAAEGYAWWHRRLGQMAGYFDALRLDHLLGFFRIWSIPETAVEGILGHFEPALPLLPEELTAHGIDLPRERLTQPFINEAVLDEIFGGQAQAVRRQFLRADPQGGYALKPEFATQRQVADYFAGERGPDAPADEIQTGLYDLLSNVILIETGGGLHFQIAMMETSSFKALPAALQAGLRRLYADFFQRQDAFWRGAGRQRLAMLKQSTDLLVCGEDMGLVPDCVPEVMRELGLLGLEIQRVPKLPGRAFFRPSEAPYLSVVTPSTHDMNPLRGWWEEDADRTQEFFNHELGIPGEAPRTAEPWVVQALVRLHLASPAMWCIFQWQDLIGMDGSLRRDQVAAERINNPFYPNYYWRYRQHLNLEKLLQADNFNTHLRQMLAGAGR